MVGKQLARTADTKLCMNSMLVGRTIAGGRSSENVVRTKLLHHSLPACWAGGGEESPDSRAGMSRRADQDQATNLVRRQEQDVTYSTMTRRSRHRNPTIQAASIKREFACGGDREAMACSFW